jgi:two-component system, OmpR family, sensor kinase
MSLRARLLLVLIGLLAVGLSLGAVGTHYALRSYLMGRLDQQVRDAHPVMEQTLLRGTPYGDADDRPSGGIGVGGGRDLRFGTSYLVGTYGALYDHLGHLLLESSPGPGGTREPTERPAVTARQLATAEIRPDLATVPLWTVSAANGHDGRFRVLAERFDGGDVLVVAVPFTEMDATLGRVATIEIIASSIVMVALAALAFVIIRVGLRPLTRIEQTADEIAWGDLTRRVADTRQRTEVGRLGRAFNAMLTQIESAFREREASEQRLRRFIADASHELRTPLTSIRGYAEMFHRGAAQRPEDLALAMRRIEEESARMSGLVDDLLLLARLDQKPVMERESVDVAALVRDIVADARAVAPDRRFTVDAPAFLEVVGDQAQLRQAVGNLVRNALVHTPADTPILVTAAITESAPISGRPAPMRRSAAVRHELAPPETRPVPPAAAPHEPVGPLPDVGPEAPPPAAVAAHQTATDESVIVISVIDHGPGIPVESVDLVFDRFYRADRGRSRDVGGSGLGLSIVAAVAAAHGGRVTHEPTPGGGATFRLTIPRP